MPNPRRRMTFQAQLRESGHPLLIVMPLLVAIGCMVGQALFTDYLHVANASYLYIIIGVVLLLTLSEAFVKNTSRNWRITEQLLYYLVTFIGFGFVLPLPSPYLIFLILLGILTYFDFGLKGLNIGLWSLFIGLTIRFLQINGFHDATNFSLFLVSYLTAAVMTYYAVAFLKTAQDELDQVDQSTAQARLSQQRVESLINNITDGVIAVDHMLNIVIYNAAALDVLDVNIDVKGKKLSDLFKPIDAEHHSVDIGQVLEATTVPTVNRELRLKYNDGSVANLFLGIAPIYLGYGKAGNNGYTLLLRDITREKSLEEERNEFISVVSHELRTPIAIAEGNISNAEFINQKTGDPEAIKTALMEAHNQVLFLSEMINDLSTLSRAERGKLQVEIESINVHDLLKELGDNYQAEAQAKGLKLELDLDPKLELLHNSKLYVREILQNFITNAIKYTQKGQVRLAASADAKGIRFEVSDSGIGISKGDQERVFDKFFRSEDFRTRQVNGTGLGLYVTMKLARLIHAEIELESELNKGSTFRIFIPNLEQTVATASAADKHSDPSKALH